jgi:ABC-type lipoprotein export system ATPase subunit
MNERAVVGAPHDPVLTARDLFHIYREGDMRTIALRGADITLGYGTWTTVMGPSGSGKSTLLHILGGLIAPSAGSVIIDGEDVTRLTPARQTTWRRRSIGLVLQRDNLHPHLDVADNIALPLHLQGCTAAAVADRVAELACQVGLAERTHHRVGQLSGGESQRAAVAVALASRPMVLLADEPTGELDEVTAAGILDLLTALIATDGTSILTVTHNVQVTERAARKLVMRDGVVIDAA